MKSIYIFRSYQPQQTLSEVIMKDENSGVLFECHSIELEWNNNERGKSCIPEGEYIAKKHTSPKFGSCLWLQDVPNRKEILIHPANYSRQLRGCIALGMDVKDIDTDGLLDVTESRKAVNKVLELMGDDKQIEVIIS